MLMLPAEVVEDDSGSSREGDPSPVMRGVGPSAQFTNPPPSPPPIQLPQPLSAFSKGPLLMLMLSSYCCCCCCPSLSLPNQYQLLALFPMRAMNYFWGDIGRFNLSERFPPIVGKLLVEGGKIEESYQLSL